MNEIIDFSQKTSFQIPSEHGSEDAPETLRALISKYTSNQVESDVPTRRIVDDTLDALASSGRTKAKNELNEAIQDLRSAEPNVIGAIDHSIAALEFVAKDVCGQSSSSLGRIVNLRPDRFPAPLAKAVNKLYLTECGTPSRSEAELAVSVSAAITNLLLH